MDTFYYYLKCFLTSKSPVTGEFVPDLAIGPAILVVIVSIGMIWVVGRLMKCDNDLHPGTHPIDYGVL